MPEREMSRRTSCASRPPRTADVGENCRPATRARCLYDEARGASVVSCQCRSHLVRNAGNKTHDVRSSTEFGGSDAVAIPHDSSSPNAACLSSSGASRSSSVGSRPFVCSHSHSAANKCIQRQCDPSGGPAAGCETHRAKPRTPARHSSSGSVVPDLSVPCRPPRPLRKAAS